MTGNINGELDEYSFTGVAGGTLQASAGGSFYGQGLKLAVDLFDPAGKLLTTAKTANAEQVVVATAKAATTGTYYAVVRSLDGGGGNYNLTVATLPGLTAKDVVDGVGGPIVSGAAVTGNINGQLDVYTFGGTAGQRATVTAGGSFYGQGYRAAIDLYGPGGVLLGTSEAVKAQAVASISTLLPSTGYYYVVVRSPDGSGGNYTLTLGGTLAAPPLNVVAGITATAGTFTDGVHVGWSTEPSAYAYEVLRSTTNSAASAYVVAPVVVGSTYDDTSAAPGTLYYYFIDALSAVGVSTAGTSAAGYTAPDVYVTAAEGRSATAGTATTFVLGNFRFAAATGPFVVDVNWGDGSADTKFSVPAAGTIPAQAHTYTKAGADTVTVTVTDAKGHKSNAATFAVAVAAKPAAAGDHPDLAAAAFPGSDDPDRLGRLPMPV